MKRGVRGFTLIEVVLAVGLLSILVLALIRLIDTSMRIWSRAENERDVSEVGMNVLELMAEDLAGLEPGPRGDLLCEYFGFDSDGDGTRGRLLSRLRFVRQAAAADIARLDPGSELDPRAFGLMEVAWALLPEGGGEPDRRGLGRLVRAERRLVGAGDSFFDDGFFSRTGRPLAGVMEDVAVGVLRLDAVLASQTSIVRKRWVVGSELADCASSWDAWSKARPDPELTDLNQPCAGMAPAHGQPVLPRRIRLELELERPAELRRRARLSHVIDARATEFFVDDDLKLPSRGTLVLVDEEWMRVIGTDGRVAMVERGRRGTRPAEHQAGALLHHGTTLVRELPIAVYRDDWSLR